MDTTSISSNSIKPSGIPRLSRLPRPVQTTTVALPSSDRSTPTSLQAYPSQAPRVALKPTSANAPTNPAGRRISGQFPLRHNPIQPSTAKGRTETGADVFKKPIGRPASRQAQLRKKQNVTSPVDEPEREEDKLGALDGFRASSRQGFRLPEQPELPDENQNTEEPSTPKVRKSRPSLSERTIETLSQIEPSPGSRRRRSSFFNPESPMAPPSRPTSAIGNGKRPGTSDGTIRDASNIGSLTTTPSKRSTSAALPRAGGRIPSINLTSTPLRHVERPPSTTSRSAPRPSFSGSKTMAARTPKSRPGLGNILSKPRVSQNMPQQGISEPARKVSNTSATLREQIAKAKAAHRATSSNQNTPSKTAVGDGLDSYLHSDPFNQRPEDGNIALRRRIDNARMEGRLNIAAMGLEQIPDEVMKMYEFDPDNAGPVAWNEAVDLVSFNAADNEITVIPAEVFPDTDPESAQVDDDVKGPQFDGLETLDFRGNLLQELPVGLRRLQRLTKLNVSRNRLTSDAWSIITQIPSLRELKLGDNNLTGALPDSISQLGNLESVELQNNKLSALPEGLLELVHLRILNLSNNALNSAFPTPLTLPSLQELYLSGNQLKSFESFSTSLTAPRLYFLDISLNRIDGPLPVLRSYFPTLTHLLTSDNSISGISLEAVRDMRVVNLARNNIDHLPPEIGLLDLTSFEVEGNSFRVPGEAVLKRGTQALLAWLRDRIPEGVQYEIR